jgi:two-component system sensor histidine kinase DesK
MLAMSYAFLPWYSSALVYFPFACVMLGGCRMSMRHYLVAVALLNAALFAEAMGLLHYPDLLHYSWQPLTSMCVVSFVVGVVIYAERSSEWQRAQLRLSHEEIRRLAATAERERIGRDLHDLLGHTLSLITLKLELSRKLFDRDAEAARREVVEAERVARHTLAEVRAAVTGIRAADLVAELASARLLLESSGVHLDCEHPPEGLPPEIERPLALVLREAITNVARHAKARGATVAWSVADGRLSLLIADDGRGGLGPEGNGLAGMRERVRALRGSLEIDSPRGHGTRLTVRVPCRLAKPGAAATSPGEPPALAQERIA